MIQDAKLPGFGSRLTKAIVAGGLTESQLARAERRAVKAIREERELDMAFLPLVCRHSEHLHVDARWLALGKQSRAAEEALRVLTSSAGFNKLSVRDQHELRARFGMLCETSQGPGICMYCGCTDDCGCGDCEWANVGHTICSNCLLPEG